MPKPSFHNLKTAYERLMKAYPDFHPCDGPYRNQCAIRMSIALNDEMTVKVNAGTYSAAKCGHGHARSAGDLAAFLWRKVGCPKIYKEIARGKLAIGEKTGIVFFRDCFTRAGEKKANGDHLDLWDRGKTMTFDDPTNASAAMWFWELA